MTAAVMQPLLDDETLVSKVAAFVVHEYHRYRAEPFRPPLVHIPPIGRFVGDPALEGTTARYRCPICEARGFAGGFFIVESNLIAHVGEAHVIKAEVKVESVPIGERVDQIKARISDMERQLGAR